MRLELLWSTASFRENITDSYNGPFIPKLLAKMESFTQVTANIKKFERIRTQIRDAAHMLESHSRNGGCTTALVLHSHGHTSY